VPTFGLYIVSSSTGSHPYPMFLFERRFRALRSTVRLQFSPYRDEQAFKIKTCVKAVMGEKVEEDEDENGGEELARGELR
jgi:hypothetical protein